MGMFDEYQPNPAVVCPYCGTKLTGWQSKDGPCALFVWRQGLAAPIKQMADDDCRLPDAKIAQFRLPEKFEFYNDEVGCRFCPQKGTGQTENRIWAKTTFIVPGDAPFNEEIDLNDDNAFSPHSWRRNKGRT